MIYCISPGTSSISVFDCITGWWLCPSTRKKSIFSILPKEQWVVTFTIYNTKHTDRLYKYKLKMGEYKHRPTTRTGHQFALLFNPLLVFLIHMVPAGDLGGTVRATLNALIRPWNWVGQKHESLLFYGWHAPRSKGHITPSTSYLLDSSLEKLQIVLFNLT